MNFALADRLTQFSADHSSQIAEQWYKALSTNPKTQAYHLMHNPDKPEPKLL